MGYPKINFEWKKIIVSILLVSANACTQPSQTELDLRESLNKPLHLEMFETVRQGNSQLPFNELRQQFQYLSVIYLENGCQPCYPKFIEWQNKMDSIGCPDNYSVLFVIQGNSYETFMNKVFDFDQINDHYYTIMDSKFDFLSKNSSIPRWIIDSSILIDSENKIKMVGAPWVNEDMKNLFYKTVNNKQ